MNEERVARPIRTLKQEGWQIGLGYLRRVRGDMTPLDDFMVRMNARRIESTEDYERQASEFWEILKQLGLDS